MRFALLLLAAAALAGCKEDRLTEDLAPQTTLFVNEINLTGTDRLQSSVDMRWFGNDADGVVVGYEYSFDSLTWQFTTATDTVFKFEITASSDTFDIDLWVRAVDNDNLRDPSPAYLCIPIKNSPPVVAADPQFLPYDTVVAVLTLGLEVSDPDGNETLAEVEVKLNDGAWFALDPSVRLLSFVATSPAVVGSGTARVYTGATNSLLPNSIDDFRTGQPNLVYVRARDEGGLESEPDTLGPFFVRPTQGNLLVLDNWALTPRAKNFYQPILSSVYGSYTYIDFVDTNYIPKAGNVSLELLFGLFDNVFWYAQPGELDLIESSEGVIQEYLAASGDANKLLLVTGLEWKPEELLTSALTRVAGVDSVSSLAGNALLPSASGSGLLTASPGSGYPNIPNQSTFLVANINPIYPTASAEVIYTANLLTGGGQPWPYTQVAGTRIRNASNRVNLVYSCVPLHQSLNTAAVTQYLQAVQADFAW